MEQAHSVPEAAVQVQPLQIRPRFTGSITVSTRDNYASCLGHGGNWCLCKLFLKLCCPAEMATITSQQKHNVLTEEVRYSEKCPNEGLLKVWLCDLEQGIQTLRTEALGVSPVIGVVVSYNSRPHPILRADCRPCPVSEPSMNNNNGSRHLLSFMCQAWC